MNNIGDKVILMTDIVEYISQSVTLNAKGSNFVGLCPFHQDNNPSFTVSPSKKIYKCFVCGEGGNVISFTQKFFNLSFKESLKKLAELNDIKYVDNSIKIVNTTDNNILFESQLFFQSYLTSFEKAEVGRKYLENREISLELADEFGIGFSPQNGSSLINYFNKNENLSFSLQELQQSGIVNYERDFFINKVMIPINDEFGRVIGFSGRSIDETLPKYMNSKNSLVFNKSNVLYNFHRAIKHVSKGEIIIVEGFFDCISLYKVGIRNSVATMGTSFTKQHINLLVKNNVKKVILAMDQDSAGQKSIFDAGQMIVQNSLIEVNTIKYDNCKDLDEYIKTNNDVKEILLKKQNFFQFKINYLQSKLNINDFNQKSNFVNEVTVGLNNLENNMQMLIFSELSNLTNIDISQLKQSLKVNHISQQIIPEVKSTIKRIIPTNDDVIISYCLISKNNFNEIKNLISEYKYEFKSNLNLFEIVDEYYLFNDDFELINFMDFIEPEMFEIFEVILKFDKLDYSKVDQIIKNKMKRQLIGKNIIWR